MNMCSWIILFPRNWLFLPIQKTSPSVQSRLKQVTIELRDTLKPNTTYAINFGNALRDVNENNPLRNFVYVFSTGNQLDNGQLSGTVTLAATGGYDSTLIVVLHSNINDSAVKKIRPDYYTLIDGKGHFQFKFLPQGEYNVFVLPNDYTKMYDDSTKLFAFLNQPVNIDSNGQSVHLYAYNEFVKTEAPVQRPSLKQNNKEKKEQAKVLHFSTNLQDKQQSLLEDLKIVF